MVLIELARGCQWSISGICREMGLKGGSGVDRGSWKWLRPLLGVWSGRSKSSYSENTGLDEILGWPEVNGFGKPGAALSLPFLEWWVVPEGH